MHSACLLDISSQKMHTTRKDVKKGVVMQALIFVGFTLIVPVLVTFVVITISSSRNAKHDQEEE
jgi:fumarate reductase subunit D